MPGARPYDLYLILQVCPSAYFVHVFTQCNGYDVPPVAGKMPWYVDDCCRIFVTLSEGHRHATFDVMADASVWGLGPDYAAARILVMESLVHLSSENPGVILTNSRWVSGLAIMDYGNCPHVSMAAWGDAVNNLNEAYVLLRREALGEVNRTNWSPRYIPLQTSHRVQYGPVKSYCTPQPGDAVP